MIQVQFSSCQEDIGEFVWFETLSSINQPLPPKTLHPAHYVMIVPHMISQIPGNRHWEDGGKLKESDNVTVLEKMRIRV